jgi:hypothetical protein
LKLVEKQHRIIGHRYFNNHGINTMRIIQNSTSVHKKLATFNRKKKCNKIRTYDFSTLYTTIPHKQLKRQLAKMIVQTFNSSKCPFISVYKNDARWIKSPKKITMPLDVKKVIRLLNWLIDNIYVTFGDKLFRQQNGIPMGTDGAPFLANLFLYSYEYEWIDTQRKNKNFHILKYFRGCSRYIDDILMINNDDQMKKCMSEIYPEGLILVPDDSDGLTTPFLDLQITIENNTISTSIFDKRDTFDFPIVNFPTLSGNIPKKSSYGVFIGETVRYARACTYYNDFQDRTMTLVKKLRSQYFTKIGLLRAWRRFCDSHILLIQKYGSKVLEIT